MDLITGRGALRFLVLDDNPDDRTLASRELRRHFPAAETVEIGDRDGFEAAFAAGGFELVVTDFQMRWTTGLEIVRRVKERWPELPVIMFTATGTEEIAVEAMKAGLDDYVVKSPRHYVRLATSVRTCLDRYEIRARAIRSETRLHALLESIRVGVFRMSVAGEIVDANRAFVAMLGARGAEGAAVHPLLAEARARLGTLRAAGDVVEAELALLQDEGGEPQFYSLKLARVRVNGHEAVDGIVDDVTATRRADRELQRLAASLERRVEERTRQLAESNEALEHFGLAVAHDLREPLRALQGYVLALREDCWARLEADCRGYLERIGAVARKLDALVSDLHEFARLAREELAAEPCEPQLAAAEAWAPLAQEPAASVADVAIEAPMPALCAHYPTLVQVLTNLLSNALKFVAPGECPVIRVLAERRDDRVRVCVVDRGIGIAAEDQARIFNVLERLHGEERYAGTGIGLALVRKAVERMGGSVGVESALGAGSRFWIELPRAD